MGWLVAGAGMLVFNTLLGAGRLAQRLPDSGNRIGFAFGHAIALSLVVGILALLSQDNRNPRSLGKVLFWTQVVALFLTARL